MKTAKKVDDKKISVKLTERQANLLIESLLFASSVNIGSEWGDKDKTDLVDLAVHVKSAVTGNDLSLKNLTFYDDEELCEPWTSTIQQNFEMECFEIKALGSI